MPKKIKKLFLNEYRELKTLSSKKFFKVLLFIYLLIFTLILRSHYYHLVPTANHLDEMQFAWSGLYLIETGVPVSWSNYDYPKYSEVFKGKISYNGGLPEASVTLYKPWIEEPPLFSLIVGYFAHKYHADRTQFIPSSYIRIPMLYIAAATSVMIFLVTRIVSGYWTGILAMLLYGTIPIFVFSSRLAMAENLTSLIYTVIVYLFFRYISSQKFLYMTGTH